MIGYLKGEVLEQLDGKLLVLAGTGVGYLVHVPANTNYLSLLPSSKIELLVHTHVREDALDLYGFLSRQEKDIFSILLGVNGIGPKAALGILSRIEPTHLVDAILSEDVGGLVKVPGVGKKTAERVILELAEPLRKRVEAGLFNRTSPTGAAASSAASEVLSSKKSLATENSILRDAKDALMGLGYREQDIHPLLKRAFEDSTPPDRVEDLIRIALQQLK